MACAVMRSLYSPLCDQFSHIFVCLLCISFATIKEVQLWDYSPSAAVVVCLTSAQHIRTPENIVDGGPQLVLRSLGAIWKSRGASELHQENIKQVSRAKLCPTFIIITHRIYPKSGPNILRYIRISFDDLLRARNAHQTCIHIIWLWRDLHLFWCYLIAYWRCFKGNIMLSF